MKRRLCTGSSAGCAFANEQQESIGVIALLENNIANIFKVFLFKWICFIQGFNDVAVNYFNKRPA